MTVGDRIELEVGPIAHGGHCVARRDGQVVFVRHALPGERVVATITDETTRFLRADATEILEPAAGRVEPACAVSGPGGCGGCDFQHVDLTRQRELLGDVVQEQLLRLAGIDRTVTVEGPRGERPDGLGWRSRVTFTVDADGRLGLRKHRSHDVVPLEDCPIAQESLPQVLAERWPARQVTAVASSTGERLVCAEDVGGRLPKVSADGTTADGVRVRGRTYVTEVVRDRRFRVTGAGFWQVHPRAAETLVEAVLALADARAGEQVADLYAGVGLFSAFLAEQVGREGRIVSVEGDATASRDARRSMHDLGNVEIVGSSVEDALAGGQIGACDLVVLDPPRSGARARAVRAIAALAPSRVVYVACDPAALARDLRTFGEQGYHLADLRAYDLFPMTHHVECVALLRHHLGPDE